MKLLAGRVNNHDSNFTYFDGNKIEYYKPERYHQIKHYGLPSPNWETEIFHKWGITSKDLDEFVILHDGLPSDWDNGGYFFPTQEDFNEGFKLFDADCKVTRLNHHYAHALSYWMMTDKEPDVSIVIDGHGDFNKTWSVFKNNQLIEEGTYQQNGSIGIAMAEAGMDEFGITRGDPHDTAGKLMGLQTYGKVDKEYKKFLSQWDMYNNKHIFDIENWYNFKGELIGKASKLDWIATVHDYMGEVLVKFFQKHCNKDDTIFYSGGVAHNVIWNTELKKHFPNLLIPPHAADDGVTLGAMEFLRRKHNLPKFKLDNFPFCQPDESVEPPTDETIKRTARLLSEGKVVGWYQGNGEIGPRALGNRSILFDPRVPNGRDIVNKVKNRENYRPFGASVLHENLGDCFWDTGFDNPHMLYVYNVKNSKGHKINLESITHADNTCRAQTVKDENPIFRKLLEEFYKLTGCPVLLNTSLNLAGLPIAGHTKNAKYLFDWSDLDVLVVGDEITTK